MRRRLLLLAAVVPSVAVATAFAAHGCSNEPPFESVCGWVGDPENCFREFHEDMLAAKGPDNMNGDCRTYPPFPVSAIPTEASQAAPGVSNGSFQKRAMLDMCILNAGGSVTINPPVDLTMFPPSPYAAPITYKMTFINPDSNPCGSATYTSPHGFSITINPPPDAGTTAMTDASVDATAPVDGGPELDDSGPPIPNGTYTQVIASGRDAFDVTCPSGETHHFTLDELNPSPGADAGPCPEFANVVPEASFQIFLGGTDIPGALSFAIVYPPESPTTGSEAYPDGGPPLVPDRVVYFNCSIPAAAETCADGVKDGVETDVDCGGPQMASMLQCGNCPPRCEVSQQCICDSDCDEAAGLVCAVNTMSGMRQCGPPVVDGGTVTHFSKCAYDADAGPPCTGTGGGDAGTGGSDAGTDAGDAGPNPDAGDAAD